MLVNYSGLKERVISCSYGGKELDSEKGFGFFNARFYDASLWRFINVDPVGDGLNWYGYCSNNPVNYVDPTGLKRKLKMFNGVSMRDLPSEALIEIFSNAHGNPYARQQTISNADAKVRFPSKMVESEYSTSLRVIQGLFPVGIDDTGAGTKAHSITDAMEGGWGQLRITIYSNNDKTGITGWTLEQNLPGDGEGAALNQPDFKYQAINDKEIAESLLFKNHDLMADALNEILSNDILEELTSPYQEVDAVTGAAPILNNENK